MAEITLPRWIISQMNMPNGIRSAKKPILVIPHEFKNFSMGSSKGKGYEPEVIDKVFEHWEYRFWCMATWPPAIQILAECRCCGHLGEQDMSIRREHFKQGGCTKRLVKAYDLLLKDMKCVICDLKARSKMWGVPICSDACREAWCTTEATPKALQEALRIVGEDI